MHKEAGRNLLMCFDFDSTSFNLLAEDILRPELFELLQESVQIQRFVGLGLPDYAIEGENVHRHTLRLACRVCTLPLTDTERSEYLLTLLIHDLPETKTLIDSGESADTTATIKSTDAGLELNVEYDEMVAAHKIFTSEELGCYEEFDLASRFLKSKETNLLPTDMALLCKILDKVDADLFFHLAARQAALQNHRDLGNLWGKAQELAFKQYGEYSDRLRTLEDTNLATTAVICQSLLDTCMIVIIQIWSKVPKQKIPRVIQENITQIQKS